MKIKIFIIGVLISTLCWKNTTAQASDIPLGNQPSDSVKQEMAKQQRATAALFAKTKLTSMVTKHDGYGYYILADGNIIIDQQQIPAVSGNKGFVSQAEAKRTAALAIQKLQAGEMPPTISVEDLKRLNITLPASKK